MSRYDVSTSGAEALMKLSKDLLSAYGNITNAGGILEQKVEGLEEKDIDMYSLIVESARSITATVEKEKDTFMTLAKNLMSLSIRIREIIGDITTLEISGGINSAGAGIDKRDNLGDAFENSAFTNRIMNDFRIENVDVHSIRNEYRGEVYNAIKVAIDKYPELKGQLREVNCIPLDTGVFAAYGPTKSGEPFGGVLNVNSDFFANPDIQNALTEQSRAGNFIPNASPESIIAHELAGHGNHLSLCARKNGIKYGEVPTASQRMGMAQEYIDNYHVREIVEAACRDCGIAFGSDEFRSGLSNYGASDYGEAFAEAMAEQQNSCAPRNISNAIRRQYDLYKLRTFQ